MTLHQSIAYPAKQLSRHSATLPSSTSAQTCLAAAKEIIMIAKEYLRASNGITNPQFSFCLFIAGRVLLDPNGNLASRFASRLETAQTNIQKGSHDKSKSILDIREPAYSDQTETGDGGEHAGKAGRHGDTPSYQDQQKNAANQLVEPTDGGFLPSTGFPQQMADNGQSPDSISLAFPPLPLSFQQADFTSGAFSAFNGMAESQAFTSPSGGFNAENSYPELEEFKNMFDDPFQQNFRVSTYSGIQNVDSQEPMVEDRQTDLIM
ncbi:hypothetical protein SLS56_005155 [Neofusicoccum ribis]|uniref:Uncharacterized protein n=1 Tax=Neofusicoccum ribis TaxID=45134 RepID=A0ABR3SUD9_9PEZI